MKIFAQRPLSLILCMMLGGFLLFSCFDTLLRIALVTGAAVSLLAIAALRFAFSVTVKKRYVIGILLTLISLLLSFLYCDMCFFADRRFSEECTVTAVVTDIDYSKAYGAQADITTEQINGEPLTRYKMRLQLNASGTELQIGDRIRFSTTLAGFTSDDGFLAYEYSKGYSAVAETYDYELLETDASTGNINRIFSQMRSNIGTYMIEVAGEDAGALLFALLIGDRSTLSGLFRLDFTRLGLTHILAISGMHLAILAFLLHKLLSLFGMRKGVRLFVICAFVIFYMALTGFPSSVVRAGVMLILSSILYALSKTKDGVSSLVFSVFLIVLCQPYAIFDLSLQLSALSTLGILVGVEISEDRDEGRLRRLFRPILTSLLFSYLAISFTLAICALRFDYISMVGIFTTPIFSLLTEGFMFLGLITLLLGWIFPIGRLLTLFYQLIGSLAHFFSQLPVYLSVNFPALKIVIFVYTVLLFLFIVCSFKHRLRVLSLLVCAFVAIYASVFVLNDCAIREDDILYALEEDEEHILVRSNGTVALFDMTATSYSSSRKTAEFLSAQHTSSLDYFVITQYTANSSTYVKYVLSSYQCKFICLPSPKSLAENEIAYLTERIAESFAVAVIYYEIETYLTVGDMRIYFVSRTEYTEGAKVIYCIYDGEGYHTYFSRGAIDSNTKTAASELLGISQSVILGCRGRAYANGYTFDTRSYALDLLILSDGEMQIDKEVLAYYAEHKRVEYRPDLISLIH